MKKILVTIYVLSLQQEFDVFIPITMNMNDAISLIQDSIVKLSNENYQKKDNVMLFDEDGKIINLNNKAKFSGLNNGSKVILL